MSRKARAYIKARAHLPKPVRKMTDSIVLNRGLYLESLERRAEKGKQQLKKLIIGKQRKRR